MLPGFGANADSSVGCIMCTLGRSSIRRRGLRDGGVGGLHLTFYYYGLGGRTNVSRSTTVSASNRSFASVAGVLDVSTPAGAAGIRRRRSVAASDWFVAA